MSLSISPAGLDLVKRFEGCRLDAYQDSVGVWTLGYGSTKGVKQGDEISQEEADNRLRNDLADAEACVNATTPNLTQNRFDACVSFVFNLGCSAYKHSTLVKMIWAEDYPAAAAEFQRWNRAGGRPMEGLANRRRAEAALFSEA